MARETSGQMSQKEKKKHFWGSVSSKFVFPDWACVKFRQQRFLEHYDEAKPPWGSWAILLFKVWTGAAFICHCILHRSVCSSLCCFISLSFPHPLVMMMAQYMDVCSLRVHLPSPQFFLLCFLSLYPENRVKDPKVAILNVSCYADESFMPCWMLSLE